MYAYNDDESIRYYDLHPTEEDLMPEGALHAALLRYLMDVLEWLFREQLCAIHQNLGFYELPELTESPLAPDIAIIKGVPYQPVSSWRVGKTGPVPQVVFEILSPETWQKDVEEKPLKYALARVHEYFAYDPNLSPLAGPAKRLFGWRLDSRQGVLRRLPLRQGGYLWSYELDSFLVPDGRWLRLYDRDSRLRLTRAEAEAEARRVAERQARAEAEARQAAERKARALAEKLRSLGIDPDQV